jgi:hypothetical protein
VACCSIRRLFFPQLSADHLVTCVDIQNSFPIVETSNSASVLVNVGRIVLRIGTLNCFLLPRSWCQAARVLLQASANASTNPLPHPARCAPPKQPPMHFYWLGGILAICGMFRASETLPGVGLVLISQQAEHGPRQRRISDRK